MQCVSSGTVCSVYHMRFGALVRRRKLCDFFWYPGVWQVSVTHSFCFFSLHFFSLHQQAYFLPHRLISIHQAPVVTVKSSVLFSPCLSTSSCQPHQHQTCSAPDKVKLKHTLTLYIDKNVTSFKRRGTFEVVNTERFITGKITLKVAKRVKMRRLFSLATLCLKEAEGEIILKWEEAFKGLTFWSACPSTKKKQTKSTCWCLWSLGVLKVSQSLFVMAECVD